jgi:uncharacterized caspase-like protein
MKNRRENERVVRQADTVPNVGRRRVLQGMLGGGVLAATGVDLSAQSTDTLIALPRYALVIGNSQYKDNPLKNPARDADAMSAALERTGFAVSRLLDAGRDQMRNAIETYGANLAKQGAVGLFYFAGHGMQLAWRNYLIPVDAVVDNPDDVRERAVDLNSLLQGLTRAKNPMNVIILDACRDNPFGTRFTTGQKGLSQFDAPPGSLLAYATAPGNTAADGEGANGLYTENLLREIGVPDAKIEDVFKRVRLHVRRQTNGQQIPWESTSLEEDFYFVPPQALLAAAEEEIARERRQVAEAREKQRLADEAERKRREDEARQEAQRAAAEAERKRKEALAALEQKRRDEEAELERKREAALKEAQRVAEEAERKHREEEAQRQAQLAKEEADRKYREELAAREQQLAAAEAERKRKEEEAVRAARLAQDEADRKRKEAQALEDRKREQAEAERRRAAAQAAAGAKPDAKAVERQFEDELALWERIRDSKDAKPFEDYLLRYPSGRYSELAQLQLDRSLAAQGEHRIEVVSSADNPFSKGTVVAKTQHAVGDTYTYRQIDTFTKLVNKTHTLTVAQITDAQVIYSDGTVTDLLGNVVKFPDGRMFGPAQFVPLEYAVGRRWNTRCKVTNPHGDGGQLDLDLHITAREAVTVPAGTFNAFVIEGVGWSIGPWGSLLTKRKLWMAPDVCRRPIASESYRQVSRGGFARVLTSEREELVLFREA